MNYNIILKNKINFSNGGSNEINHITYRRNNRSEIREDVKECIHMY